MTNPPSEYLLYYTRSKDELRWNTDVTVVVFYHFRYSLKQIRENLYDIAHFCFFLGHLRVLISFESRKQSMFFP
jgi:hypothetical protein